MNQKEIRSILLQEEASPFSLCIGIGLDGEGILYLSPYQDPEENIETLSGITTGTSNLPGNQGCLVSEANISLIKQTPLAVVDRIKLAKDTAASRLEARKLEAEMATILKKISPKMNSLDVSRFTKRYSVVPDEPLTIKGVVKLLMKQYDDFDKEIKSSDVSLLAIKDRLLIKIAKGKVNRDLKSISAFAKSHNLTQGYTIAKYLCRSCPKTAELINCGKVTTLSHFWISFNTEMLTK